MTNNLTKFYLGKPLYRDTDNSILHLQKMFQCTHPVGNIVGVYETFHKENEGLPYAEETELRCLCLVQGNDYDVVEHQNTLQFTFHKNIHGVLKFKLDV